jgi:hypothetical protein
MNNINRFFYVQLFNVKLILQQSKPVRLAKTFFVPGDGSWLFTLSSGSIYE